MTDDEFLQVVRDRADAKSQGSYFALGGNDLVYLYVYAGLGEWMASLANKETADRVQRLLGEGRLMLGDIKHVQNLHVPLSILRASDEIHTVDQPASSMFLPATETPAESFVAPVPWRPGPFAARRGRSLLLKELSREYNLPIVQYAALARKTRGQVLRDIRTRWLLALSARGFQKVVPAWQLDPIKKKLTVILLRRAQEVDSWSLYYALSEPNAALDGKAPIDIVTLGQCAKLVKLLCGQLGLHEK